MFFSAARPTPTIMAVGVARPKAHGQAMANTVTMEISPCEKPLAGSSTSQVIRVSRATSITAGTNIPATLSTRCCTGALLFCALSTVAMILPSTDSDPTCSAINLKLPRWFIVPAHALSPTFLTTGIDSPEMVLSSTTLWPSTTLPSTGTLLPGFTSTTSPFLIRDSGTSLRLSPSTNQAISGCKPMIFFIDEVV